MAVNLRLDYVNGLLGSHDLNFSSRRVVLHNVLVGYVAAEAQEALRVEADLYDRGLFLAGGEEAALAADRLIQQLQTAKDDFAKICEALEHERGRATDCSHHGFPLAVTEFERPLTATTAVSQRMAYVLKHAKPSPPGASGHQQKQTPGTSGKNNGGGGFWAKRRQEQKAKKGKAAGAGATSGKAPFLGYSNQKKA